MWIESHVKLAHVLGMENNLARRIVNEALGEPAADRGQVDLLVEAMRLKFTDAEIAELKRLYRVADHTCLAKTPQKSG